VPPPANERFNCGVVTEPPAPSGHPFFLRLHDWFGGAGSAVGELVTGQGGAGRSAFESDHGFDVLSSPVSNPFLFEDPRSLTEIRPLFIHEGSSTKNAAFHGGDVDYFGFQARLALTERLSVVMSELGFIWVEPHDGGLAAHDGISELRIGPSTPSTAASSPAPSPPSACTSTSRSGRARSSKTPAACPCNPTSASARTS